MHNWLCGVYLVPLFMLLGALSSRAGEDVSDAYQRGATHLANGRFQEAVACLDECLRHDPSNKQAYRCRAFAHLLRGDPESAIADFTDAIFLDSADPVLFYGRGSAYRLLGKRGEALADFSEAIRLDPEYGPAYFARYDVDDNPESNSVDLARAMRLSERSEMDARSRPGAPYAELIASPRVSIGGFLEYSYWQFIYEKHPVSPSGETEASPHKPEDAATYKNLAVQYARKRNLAESIRSLNQAVKLAPRDQDAYKLRGVMHAIKGDLTAAVADFNRAVELNPMDCEAYTFRLYAQLESGLFKNANRDLGRIVDIMEQHIEEAEGTTIPNPHIHGQVPAQPLR